MLLWPLPRDEFFLIQLQLIPNVPSQPMQQPPLLHVFPFPKPLSIAKSPLPQLLLLLQQQEPLQLLFTPVTLSQPSVSLILPLLVPSWQQPPQSLVTFFFRLPRVQILLAYVFPQLPFLPVLFAFKSPLLFSIVQSFPILTLIFLLQRRLPVLIGFFQLRQQLLVQV